MIRFDNFSFGHPQKDLYENINFEINAGDHAVLIGSNGSGKTTLVNLIMNEEKYTYDGLIRMDKNIRIGYVSQFVEHETSELTTVDFLAAPFKAMIQKSDDLCAKMAESENLDAVYEEYQKVVDEIETVDAYNYESNIGKELAVAGLSDLADIPVTNLSGGEYKLLFIMRNMLLKPQLLIMDEPDVFLDFENLIALIKLINNHDGTLLTITHNRLLLTQCFDKVLDIENKSVREFPGNFAEYNSWMLENKIEIFEHARDFDEFIEKQEQLVKNIRKLAESIAEPRFGRQLRARATYMERLRKMRGEDPFIENHDHEFHLAFKDVAEDTSEAVDEASDMEEKPEEIVTAAEIAVNHYSLAYGDRKILENVSFTVKPGEKIAIVGTNGTGKSSMLRDIYADLEEKMPGKIGYFRQIVESDHELKLSGGERNIAQIEMLCKTPHTGLLLDEPTSHLDIYAQIELEKAVREYEGTVILVSHDLFAITACADRILMIEDGTIREMSGRAYRKSIYKKYFASDIFEAERKRIETEIKVSNLIRAGKYDAARKVLGTEKED
ncbi:ATP-binding cassette, subfamily F, member 3 [Lachnospiraceae bacterium]|nr:ATP-binding cassette, subfamily F, member 3 [Lachnospiraceae bacterium]